MKLNKKQIELIKELTGYDYVQVYEYKPVDQIDPETIKTLQQLDLVEIEDGEIVNVFGSMGFAMLANNDGIDYSKPRFKNDYTFAKNVEYDVYSVSFQDYIGIKWDNAVRDFVFTEKTSATEDADGSIGDFYLRHDWINKLNDILKGSYN